MSWCLNLYTPAISSLVYAHMYYRAKCLLKVLFFVYSLLEHNSDEKKRDCIFLNS